MAILATLASFLVYVNWLAAGFFTVLIYRRRTGYALDMQSLHDDYRWAGGATDQYVGLNLAFAYRKF